jgi:hypothetical protein
MSSINGISISEYSGFVYDGCHKIYLVKREDIPRVNEIWGNGYEDVPIYNMDDLPTYYKESCPLKFISAWDLKTHFVRQGEENVRFVINGLETIV